MKYLIILKEPGHEDRVLATRDSIQEAALLQYQLEITKPVSAEYNFILLAESEDE